MASPSAAAPAPPGPDRGASAPSIGPPAEDARRTTDDDHTRAGRVLDAAEQSFQRNCELTYSVKCSKKYHGYQLLTKMVVFATNPT